jgi:hypothetical protein
LRGGRAGVARGIRLRDRDRVAATRRERG